MPFLKTLPKPKSFNMAESIPVVDFTAWTTESTPAARLATAKELVKACHETGFVYISNHGVSSQVLSEAFAWTKKFMDMSLEEKMEAKHPEGSIAFRGYSWPGLQKANQVLDGNNGAVTALRGKPDFNVGYRINTEKFLPSAN